MATGYDCSPIFTLGSIFLKSSVYTRPSCATFAGEMSVSGEWRMLSEVRPKPSQSPPGTVAVVAPPAVPMATLAAATPTARIAFRIRFKAVSWSRAT